MDELIQQMEAIRGDEPSSEFALDHVIFATGSGGTVSTYYLVFY